MTLATLAVLLLTPIQAPDTLVVKANNPAVWGESVALVEDLRIGALEGPEAYVFGTIEGVAIGPGESVYIADQQVPVIRYYAEDGTWIRDVGRQGQGPGEYNLISGIKMLEGGPLAALDQRNGRVTHYVGNEYSTSFLSLSGLHTADPFAVDTAGASYVKTVLREPGAAISEGTPWNKGWIRFNRMGQVQDTLEIPAEDEVGGGLVVAGRGGYYRPFTVMTVSTLSPHGYVVACRNDEYALQRPLPDGRILRIERDTQPVPILAGERDQWNQWLDRARERNRETGSGGDVGPIPDMKPFVRNLFADDDGRIWVAVYTEARFKAYTEAERAERGDRPGLEWNQPLVWEVFDPRGQFLGQVTLPDKTSLMAARGNTVWGVQSGEYGEDYAVRFRIRREAGQAGNKGVRAPHRTSQLRPVDPSPTTPEFHEIATETRHVPLEDSELALLQEGDLLVAGFSRITRLSPELEFEENLPVDASSPFRSLFQSQKGLILGAQNPAPSPPPPLSAGSTSGRGVSRSWQESTQSKIVGSSSRIVCFEMDLKIRSTCLISTTGLFGSGIPTFAPESAAYGAAPATSGRQTTAASTDECGSDCDPQKEGNDQCRNFGSWESFPLRDFRLF